MLSPHITLMYVQFYHLYLLEGVLFVLSCVSPLSFWRLRQLNLRMWIYTLQVSAMLKVQSTQAYQFIVDVRKVKDNLHLFMCFLTCVDAHFQIWKLENKNTNLDKNSFRNCSKKKITAGMSKRFKEAEHLCCHDPPITETLFQDKLAVQPYSTSFTMNRKAMGRDSLWASIWLS